MNKINVAMIAYTYYSTDSRVRREAEALIDAGCNVDFIALRRPDEPETELVNGVKIYHIAQERYRGNSNIKYILAYISFFIKSSFKILFLHMDKHYKLIHINNMPDFMVFTALIPKLSGTKLILDVHDNMPELFSTKFHLSNNHWLIRFLKIQELLSAKFVDAVIAVHQLQKELLIKHGIPGEKIEIVMNVADKKIFYPRNIENDESRNKFVLVYHGTVARRHGCNVLIKAIDIVKEKLPSIRLNIYGEGDALNDVINLTNELGLSDYIHFSNGFVSLNELPDLLAKADIGIVPNIRDIYTNYMLPVKLLEYVTMKIPVIASQIKTIEYYFDSSQVRYFEPEDENSLAKAILDMYYNPSKRKTYSENASRFEKKYNWEQQKRIYFRLVKKLLSEKS